MCLGLPGRVVEVVDDRGTPMAVVDFGGVTKQICCAYLPDIAVGEYAIVHAGFALARLDEAAALETLALLRSLGSVADEVGPGGAQAMA
ncbi:MAG: HypC/HybG/HupF family hydrogenase formation chaperone [Acidimicrobiales bacterium]